MAKTFKLSNGLSVPSVGLGTWNASAVDVYTAVKYAIEEAGYRHIDCALCYENEVDVGKAINEVITKGILKREDLFITAKCWNTFHTREKVMRCCKKSLSMLNIEYIDLYLVHWPMGFEEDQQLFPMDGEGNFMFSDIDYVETWQGMEDCYNAGLVKSIGLSNFNSQQIKRVLEIAQVKPVMNQVECHPYLNQNKLIELCNSHGMRLTAYSPLGSPSRHWASSDDPSLLDDSKLNEIANKHNKSTAQILIRYQVQRGVVVIPKSVTPSRILSNIQIFDFELSDQEMKIIDGLDRNFRFVTFKPTESHKYYPFAIPF